MTFSLQGTERKDCKYTLLRTVKASLNLLCIFQKEQNKKIKTWISFYINYLLLLDAPGYTKQLILVEPKLSIFKTSIGSNCHLWSYGFLLSVAWCYWQ